MEEQAVVAERRPQLHRSRSRAQHRAHGFSFGLVVGPMGRRRDGRTATDALPAAV
jgi:hypothetical protein